MKVAIIGAGFTGLAAAWILSEGGGEVEIWEKNAAAGGLAGGIRSQGFSFPAAWTWDLEQYYHHWFTNDEIILNFIREQGWGDFLLKGRPKTAVWLENQIWALDSPRAVLQFRPLSLLSRLRLAAVLAYLKYFLPPRHFKKLEKIAAAAWLEQSLGKEGFTKLWLPLLKAKFGPYFSQVNLAWFWARIYKRTPQLVYFRGGFPQLIHLIEKKLRQRGVKFNYQQEIEGLKKGENEKWVLVNNKGHKFTYEQILLTLPSAGAQKLFPPLKAEFSPLFSLGAQVLIFAFARPFLPEQTYWLNISVPDWPFVVAVEQTNWIDSQFYGREHVLYLGNYLVPEHKFFHLSTQDLIKKFIPFLRQINPSFSAAEIKKAWRWRFQSYQAQPLVGLNHSQKIPPLATSFKGLYLANQEQIYPWDRGTNYAWQLGREAAQLMLNEAG